MKKFLKSFLVVVLCFCFGLTLVGCKPNIVSETTNITEGVASNGGVVLYHDGWIYFINGSKTVNEANVKANNVLSGIYRVKTMDDGSGRISYKPSTTDEDGNEVKEFTKIEQVSSNLVGFDDGSIFIFGNFLYYTTPCDSKDRDGTMLTGKTEFRRIDLKNFADQLLYTTTASDDTITYEYYKQDSDLYLTIYEKNSATLTSLKIDKKVTTAFKKEEVRSAVLSTRFGEGFGATGKTDNYLYYTLNYDAESDVLKGSRVYRICPDGSGETKISEGHTLTLLSIEYDYLVYYEELYGVRTTYAQKISDKTTALSFAKEDVISNVSTSNAYSECVFFLEEGKLKMLVFSGHWISVVDHDPENLENDSQRGIVEFDDAEVIHFIDIYDDYIVYQLTTASDSTSGGQNLVYKVKFKNLGNAENRKICLSTTKPDAGKGLLAPEIYNGYLYCFVTETASNTIYLYRINMKTPEERGETNEDGTKKGLEAAEFIGVKE